MRAHLSIITVSWFVKLSAVLDIHVPCQSALTEQRSHGPNGERSEVKSNPRFAAMTLSSAGTYQDLDWSLAEFQSKTWINTVLRKHILVRCKTCVSLWIDCKMLKILSDKVKAATGNTLRCFNSINTEIS